ncbi:hypothetical protein [Streptomyces althioticus]|uniref:hypothetical protein n=1 Tax=Streptomyces althioticus TaxID=83380 RepID=UPI003406C79B
MLRLITSEEPVQASADVLGMIYGGTITTTQTWVETSALLVTKVLGEPFGCYYLVVMTSDLDEDDISELDRLSRELGKDLRDCVVERERHNKAHRFFPGSTYFDLVTLYRG